MIIEEKYGNMKKQKARSNNTENALSHKLLRICYFFQAKMAMTLHILDNFLFQRHNDNGWNLQENIKEDICML